MWCFGVLGSEIRRATFPSIHVKLMSILENNENNVYLLLFFTLTVGYYLLLKLTGVPPNCSISITVLITMYACSVAIEIDIISIVLPFFVSSLSRCQNTNNK